VVQRFAIRDLNGRIPTADKTAYSAVTRIHFNHPRLRLPGPNHATKALQMCNTGSNSHL
jgi:hypothetical protein